MSQTVMTEVSLLQVAFDFVVAHVDEGAAVGWELARSQEHVKEVFKSLRQLGPGGRFLALGLEDAFLAGTDVTVPDREAARQKIFELVTVSKKHLLSENLDDRCRPG